MATIIISDIHGCLPALKQALHFFDTFKCNRILLLGDYLNYGPRNGVPEGLDAMKVAETLNNYMPYVTAVRGNCDSEVDQMLIKFPMMADYALVEADSKRIFMTHGHIYNEDKLPSGNHDFFLYGHTHLPVLHTLDNGLTICNPGSITFPKGGNPPSFALLTEGKLKVITLEGTTMQL